ncbi:MAG: alpha/beta fold hydrolase [Verrucomicrobiota bacterium]
MLSVSAGDEAVVLLHGLARSPRSMAKMERALKAEGYQVHNLGYPSRKHPMDVLATGIRARILETTSEATRVHFVTHSLGGILVRYIQHHHPIPNLGRVVMLSPPNHGSEVTDALGKLRLYHWLNGPVGQQLGTRPDGLIAGLPPVDFETGVLTGDRSINLFLSTLIPGKDDGKVSVESARLEGMRDFKVVHASHPMIMRKKKIIRDVKSFLATGKFFRPPETSPGS